MAYPSTASTSDNVLMVEGRDDLHVVTHIWRRLHSSEPTFAIEPQGSVSELLPNISPTIRRAGTGTVGILVDADDDPAGRWNAVRDRVLRYDISASLPQGPVRDGTIVDAEIDTGAAAPKRTVRIGIWLMPDNASTGELEDFVAGMVPDGDPVWPLSEDYIAGIPDEHRKFIASKTLRAKLHAWLAAREDPRQMGLAIRTGDLETNGDLCRSFAAWITKLFR